MPTLKVESVSIQAEVVFRDDAGLVMDKKLTQAFALHEAEFPAGFRELLTAKGVPADGLIGTQPSPVAVADAPVSTPATPRRGRKSRITVAAVPESATQ